MQVHCDTCNAMIRADDMDLSTGLAKCRFCHSVFALPVAPQAVRAETRGVSEQPSVLGYGAQGTSYTEAPAYGSGPVYEVPYGDAGVHAFGGASSAAARMARGGKLNPTPGGIIVTDTDGGLRIERRWFSPKHIFFAVFSVIWWGFLVVWYGITLSTGAPLIFSLFPLIHVAAGVFVAYMALTGFVNRTLFTVQDGVLTVKHGPLPWPGNRSITTADIQQLYCEERRHNGKNGPSYTYRLSAVLRGGTSLVVLDGLDTPDIPRFVEERVERMLHIGDAPVTGEMPK